MSVPSGVGVNPRDEKVGVYAVRIYDPDFPGLRKDEFLMWMGGKWSYLMSDQIYRGEVLAWVGPIPRNPR